MYIIPFSQPLFKQRLADCAGRFCIASVQGYGIIPVRLRRFCLLLAEKLLLRQRLRGDAMYEKENFSYLLGSCFGGFDGWMWGW